MPEELTDTHPARSNRLLDQRPSFDDEETFFVTRTAAPEKAPQSLNLWVRVRELIAQRAALAACTNEVNAAASVIARSANILRSISMPDLFSPSMNLL